VPHPALDTPRTPPTASAHPTASDSQQPPPQPQPARQPAAAHRSHTATLQQPASRHHTQQPACAQPAHGRPAARARKPGQSRPAERRDATAPSSMCSPPLPPISLHSYRCVWVTTALSSNRWAPQSLHHHPPPPALQLWSTHSMLPQRRRPRRRLRRHCLRGTQNEAKSAGHRPAADAH
jgi:hypothetical protein